MKWNFEELGCALEPISLPHDLVDLAVRAFTQEVLILKVDIICVLFRCLLHIQLCALINIE